MTRRLPALLLAVGWSTAWAQPAAADAHALMWAALEAQAPLPSAPPRLPDVAADAQERQGRSPSRRSGSEAAKSEAAAHAVDSAEAVGRARREAALHAASVGSVNAASQAAAGQQRAAEAKAAAHGPPRPPRP